MVLTQEVVFHWQFKALPFGLAASPRIFFFMKILAEAVAHLHLQGIVVIPYVDDLLISGPSAAQVETDTQKVICPEKTGLAGKLGKILPGIRPTWVSGWTLGLKLFL